MNKEILVLLQEELLFKNKASFYITHSKYGVNQKLYINDNKYKTGDSAGTYSITSISNKVDLSTFFHNLPLFLQNSTILV